ncbi:MAG: cell division protein FtsL [Alcaligenaceae bacterium]|nr:cell division protein FtsL [Alcaligenaceae bacterium]
MARLILLLLVMGFVYSAIMLVSVRYQQRQIYVNIEKAQAIEKDLEVDWSYLQLERAQLTTNANILQVTSEKLKMQMPHIGQIIYIKDSELDQSLALPVVQQDE